MARLGQIERLVLGLLTIHSGITTLAIAEELERSEGQILQTIERLKDKGLIDDTNQPVARKR